MATSVAVNEPAMTEITGDIPLPEGIQVMKSDGKIYVIDEILNFYQRKLCNSTVEEVKALGHHVFQLETMQRSKEVLLALWKWRKCVPSSENNHITKNLEQIRSQYRKKKCYSS